jgi:putative acetyltransferase
MVSIRPEEPRDYAEVRALNLAAFDDGPEAGLVDTLGASWPDHVSLVAEDEGHVVGHILFTPIVVEGSGGSAHGMALAPMAVLPERQREGVGSLLVHRGLEIMRERSTPFVVVLGHPEYYPRFGFEPASRFGLRSQWDGVPEEAFMVKALQLDAFPPGGGVAGYRPEFEVAM